MATPDETELITPDSDIQQIYMQIMTLVYHKVWTVFILLKVSHRHLYCAWFQSEYDRLFQ